MIPAPLSIYREIRKLPAGHTLTWSGGTTTLARYARPGPLARSIRCRRSGAGRGVPGAAPRLRSRPPDRGRAGRRPALGRRRLGRARGARRRGIRGRGADVLDRLRGVVVRRARRCPGGLDAATPRSTGSSCSGRMPHCSSRRSQTPSTSRSPTRPRSRPTSSRGSLRRTSRWRCRARAATSSSAATTPTSPTGSPSASGRPSSLVRPAIELLPTSTRKASFDYKAKRFARSAHLPPLERHHGWKEIFAPDARAELTGHRSAYDPVDLLRARFAETEGHDPLARLQDVDFGVYLVDDLLVKTDRASMAWSLEARVPFMDPAVASFAFSLPAHHKVRGLQKKRLLRKAAEPLLPPEVVHGRKRGFSIPAAAWLRGDLLPFARETLSPDNLRRQGFLQPERRRPAARRPRSGPRGPLPPALGPARLHALARAPRRRHPPRCAARAGRRVKVWVDFTASAHPLVFRPLVRLLEQQGHEVEITARDYAQTLQLIEAHGMTATVIGHHGGRSSLGKARQLRTRLAGAARLGGAARLRSRARARLARADDDGAPARHPQLDDVRLRVGVAPAPARMPCGHARRRPGGDPARAARPLPRDATEAAAVSRASRRSTTFPTSSPTPRS